MTYKNIEVVECINTKCTNSHKNHSWGQIKAHDAGWFQMKDGTQYCPEHVPDWVAKWRAKKKI